MGYNTVLTIINDGLDQIAADKDIGQKIADGIHSFDAYNMNPYQGVHSISAGNHANPIQVVSMRHADVTQLVAVGQNLGRLINGMEDQKPSEADLHVMMWTLRNNGYMVAAPES